MVWAFAYCAVVILPKPPRLAPTETTPVPQMSDVIEPVLALAVSTPVPVASSATPVIRTRGDAAAAPNTARILRSGTNTAESVAVGQVLDRCKSDMYVLFSHAGARLNRRNVYLKAFLFATVGR